MKRTLSVLVVFILCVTMFAGCGGNSSNVDAPSAPAADSSAPAADSGAQAASPAPADGGTLTVMAQIIPMDGEGAEFRALVKERLGIDVHFETSPLEYPDAVNKITTMLATGDSSVDVYHIDEIMQLAFLSAGFLEPIGDVVTESDMANFLPGYPDMFLKKDGQIYAVPADISGIIFFVNKQMFDEAGVSIPTNQEEFIAAAQALTKDGKYGLMESWDKASHLQDNLNRWSLMFGGNFYDWNLEGTQNAIKFMHDLVHTYNVVNIDNLSDAFESGNQKMIDGMAAMYFQWAGAANSFKNAGKGDEIVAAPMPTFVTNHTPMSSWMFVVNKNSENAAMAKEFLKLMVEPEAQALYMKSNWRNPTANVKAWDNPALMAGLNHVEVHKQYLERGSLTPRTLSTKHSEYMDVVTGTLQRYLLNEISFEECIELGQQQIDRILASS